VADVPGPLASALQDRYDIERELGAGGMAVVYLARDLRHGRLVALKVLRAQLGALMGAERFHREIRLAAQLVHPHILPLLDSGEAAGRLWYAMPFIEGESLRARLDRETQLPVEETVRLAREIADALAYAHARGILHRDIKPENILLSGGHALVADFGIARALDESEGDRITSSGMAVGTAAYMSPEQAAAERRLDARSDLYALGCVTYEMLAGEPPFTGPTAQSVMARRLSQPVPPLRIVRPQVPEAVEAALRKALAPVPADRFSSTTEFAVALTASPTGSTPAVPAIAPIPAPTPRRRLGLIALAAALVLVAIGAVWLARNRPAAPATAPVPPGADSGLRLAVLPFRSLSRDSADAYFADGLTEEVNATLSNLGGLRVIAPSSVLPYRGSSKPPGQIAAELRADALLDATVYKAGDSVRINVRLIDPRTQVASWNQQYNRTLRNVLAVQSDVATQVARVLRVQLATTEARSLARPPTTNPDAYDHYLRGLSREEGRAEIDSAIAEYEQAVALDSNFAAAWGVMARDYVARVFNFEEDRRWLDRAEAAIDRALAVDSANAEAWLARGDLQWNALGGWHFEESLAAIRRALRARPSYAKAHASLGSLLFHYGFHDAARAELRRSISLDPSDGCRSACPGFSRPRLVRVLWYEQKFDSALAGFRALPVLGGWAREEAIVLGVLGRPGEGLAVLDSARPRETGISPESNADFGSARALLLAMQGKSLDALRQIGLAIARRNTRSHFHHAQFTIACTYARLGRKADAVEWLRKTAENGMPNLPLFRNDPNLSSLQGDVEYERLMASLGTEWERRRKLVEQ
jgi:serine/threonine-protein kinase